MYVLGALACFHSPTRASLNKSPCRDLPNAVELTTGRAGAPVYTQLTAAVRRVAWNEVVSSSLSDGIFSRHNIKKAKVRTQ